jgi:hypothetical protein
MSRNVLVTLLPKSWSVGGLQMSQYVPSGQISRELPWRRQRGPTALLLKME